MADETEREKRAPDEPEPPRTLDLNKETLRNLDLKVQDADADALKGGACDTGSCPGSRHW